MASWCRSVWPEAQLSLREKCIEIQNTSDMQQVTVSWLLAPFIFNPYQFRPSCWANDMKADANAMTDFFCALFANSAGYATMQLKGLASVLPRRRWLSLEKADSSDCTSSLPCRSMHSAAVTGHGPWLRLPNRPYSAESPWSWRGVLLGGFVVAVTSTAQVVHADPAETSTRVPGHHSRHLAT